MARMETTSGHDLLCGIVHERLIPSHTRDIDEQSLLKHVPQKSNIQNIFSKMYTGIADESIQSAISARSLYCKSLNFLALTQNPTNFHTYSYTFQK